MFEDQITSDLILLVGIPASGKSTFREVNFPELKVISPDSFVGYTKENPWTPKSVMIAWKKSDELLMEYINNGESKIIFDATFVNPKRRKKYIKIAKENNIKISAIYINTPFEIATERNKKRDQYRMVPENTMQEMYKRLIPPSMEEGFDEVFYYNHDTKKLKKVK